MSSGKTRVILSPRGRRTLHCPCCGCGIFIARGAVPGNRSEFAGAFRCSDCGWRASFTRVVAKRLETEPLEAAGWFTLAVGCGLGLSALLQPQNEETFWARNPLVWLVPIGLAMVGVVCFGHLLGATRSKRHVTWMLGTSIVFPLAATLFVEFALAATSLAHYALVLLIFSFVIGTVGRLSGISRRFGFRDYVVSLIGSWSAIALTAGVILLLLGMNDMLPAELGITRETALNRVASFVGGATLAVAVFIMPVAVGMAAGFYLIGLGSVPRAIKEHARQMGFLQ